MNRSKRLGGVLIKPKQTACPLPFFAKWVSERIDHGSHIGKEIVSSTADLFLDFLSFSQMMTSDNNQLKYVTKRLGLHLEQLDTSHNAVDGVPSTLLAVIGLGRHVFGDISTMRIEHPEFKRLSAGSVDELTVDLRGDTGKILNNHGLPISVILEFQQL